MLYPVLVGNTDYLLPPRNAMIRKSIRAIVQATADFWREAAELEARIAKEQELQKIRRKSQGR